MSFIAKNPLTIPKVTSAPSTPQEGARGLFAGDDGWYDIDSDGNVKKIALSDDNISYADCDNDLKTRIDYSLYDDHFVAPTPQEDFVITYRSIDNTASIHAYVGNDTDIVVPYICYKDGAAYIVTALQSESFQNHDTIVSVALPNTITRIDAGAFLGCSNLSSINIPNGVNLIAGRMFSGCESLTSIIIPANVRAIAPLAFYGCTNLATITMPGDISVVGDEAFWGCHALTTVYYNGNKKQWSEMTVGDDNDAFLEATIVYSMRDYALSDDLEDVRRQLSRVYKPKGSIASSDINTISNPYVGDVWNLLGDVDIGDIQVITHLAAPAEIEASSVEYSYAPGSPGFNRHQICFYVDGVKVKWILDTAYSIAHSVAHSVGVTLKIDNYTFNTDTYEDCVVNTEEERIIFYMEEEVEYGEDSEWKSIADNGGTITQLDIPYENKKVIPAGSNIVWVEPGYWDMLAPTVDLSGYVAINNVSVTDKNYSGDYIKHAREINISTKKAENLVTAEEIDNVLSTEIQKINSKFGGVFHYKGSTNTLPTTNNQIGDVWNLSSDIDVGELTTAAITTTPFTLPRARIDYLVEEELDGNDEPTGYYSHLLSISVNKESVNVLPDDKGWCMIESGMPEDLKVVISGFSPLHYGGTVQGLTIGIEQEDFGDAIIFTAVILDRTTTPLITEWQELYSSGGQVEFVSIPYYNCVKFNRGDNLAWAEPGYWDTLSNTVDLTYYVKNTDYAKSNKGGVIKVWDNSQYGLFMSSGYLQVSPATSEEIAAKTHGYKPIVPARIEDAVKAGTHQSMSDSYNVGSKGELPASYTAVKNYVDSLVGGLEDEIDTIIEDGV